MKKLAAGLLVALAVAYYFGYEPSDLIPSWPASNTPPPRVRHAPVVVAQASPAQPQSLSASSGSGDDGSLANRWKSAPSPTKP